MSVYQFVCVCVLVLKEDDEGLWGRGNSVQSETREGTVCGAGEEGVGSGGGTSRDGGEVRSPRCPSRPRHSNSPHRRPRRRPPAPRHRSSRRIRGSSHRLWAGLGSGCSTRLT